MATNLGIDTALLNEALKIGKHRTKKSAVNEALREYVMRLKQREILNLQSLPEVNSKILSVK